MTMIPLRRRASAAQYLHDRWGIPCAPGTLANFAVSGTGPIYRLAGRFPVYAEADLDAWARDRLGDRAAARSARAGRLTGATAGPGRNPGGGRNPHQLTADGSMFCIRPMRMAGTVDLKTDRSHASSK